MHEVVHGTCASAKGSAEMFTGDVYFDVIAKGEEPSRPRANAVRFAQCARTEYHYPEEV
jgi:hypothetical protein